MVFMFIIFKQGLLGSGNFLVCLMLKPAYSPWTSPPAARWKNCTRCSSVRWPSTHWHHTCTVQYSTVQYSTHWHTPRCTRRGRRRSSGGRRSRECPPPPWRRGSHGPSPGSACPAPPGQPRVLIGQSHHQHWSLIGQS